MPSLYIEHLENFITEMVDDFDGTPLSSLTRRNPFHILHSLKINILPERSGMTADKDGDPSPPAGIAPVNGERMKSVGESRERSPHEGSAAGRTPKD